MWFHVYILPLYPHIKIVVVFADFEFILRTHNLKHLSFTIYKFLFIKRVVTPMHDPTTSIHKAYPEELPNNNRKTCTPNIYGASNILVLRVQIWCKKLTRHMQSPLVQYFF